MPDKIFLDTNILLYAHDLDAGAKYQLAKELVLDLWESGRGKRHYKTVYRMGAHSDS